MPTHRTISYNENVYDKTNNIYTDPVSQKEYPLAPLYEIVEANLEYTTKIDDVRVKGEINVKIIINNHCFTRGRLESDTAETLVTETKNGIIEERIFDEARYNFSINNLAHIIKNLSYKLCKQERKSTKANKTISLENASKKNPNDAIYVIMKIKMIRENLTLIIETCHHRTNCPANFKGANISQKYRNILGDWLKTFYPNMISK